MINLFRTSFAAAALSLCFSCAAISEDASTIKISAKKYDFSPNEIKLKRGKPVTLQLTTEDRSHGFNIPAFHMRTDIQPGQVAQLKLTPDKAGEYDFFCDIFCGSGHESMNGKIIVTD
jgi:cytochrome c oxidase subunit 2